MTFQTPTLPELRSLARDFLAAYLAGGADLPANSRARVLADSNAALAFGTYEFIATLAAEFLPDTADSAFLDRWANIFLDGRNAATFAEGSAAVTGNDGAVLPTGSQLAGNAIAFETLDVVTVSSTPTGVSIRALTPGVAGNVAAGQSLSFVSAIAGVDATASVVALSGGVDVESNDSLRDRVLERIRKPPMGGDADDYVAWARAVPGVTRAWCSPLEFGMGTVTVRFMMDDLRADQGGFPNTGDVATVCANVDLNRPVAVKDVVIAAPIAEPIDFTIASLVPDTASTRAAIGASVAAMLSERAAPARSESGIRIEAQTIYREWVSAAILTADGVSHFDLVMEDHPMPYNGALAVLGTITYA